MRARSSWWRGLAIGCVAACSSEVTVVDGGTSGGSKPTTIVPSPECPFTSCLNGQLATCAKGQAQGDMGYCYRPCGTCELPHGKGLCYNDEVGCPCKSDASPCMGGQCITVLNAPLGVYGACMTNCDPLHPGCPNGQTCLYSPNGGFSCWIPIDQQTGSPLKKLLGDGDRCDDPKAKQGVDTNACAPGLQCVRDVGTDTGAMYCRKLCDVSASSSCSLGKCESLRTGLPKQFPMSPGNVGVCCTKPLDAGCM